MPILNFKGKAFLKNYHNTVKFHTLVADKKKSVSNNPSLEDNLIIHGDNLIALKALLATYAGKIKCIYIDPPYNTGNENWIYNDNVNSPMILEWLGKTVSKECLTRHDKWCCMIYPRLVLLRELLKEDGVIFVSIDDNEVHHLRMIMDEIFGEENFVTSFSWQSRTSKQNDTDISINHEYILTYAKIRRQEHRRLKDENFDIWFRLSNFAFYPLPLNKERYSNPDNDHRGNWKADPFDAPNIRKNLTYIIKNPQTGEEFLPPTGRCWRTDEKKFKKLISDNRIVFGTNGRTRPQLKVFYEEKKMLGEVETTWYEGNNKGTVTEATKELQKIFEKKIFSTPKPIRLIKSLLQIATNSDDIILDSFAGSGTTAHAVLDLNAKDGGNRKFILIECEDYADNITAERIRRVIKGVPAAKDNKLKQGLGGGFSFYNLGAAIDMDEMLEGKNLPSYEDLAGYVFFTATGEKIEISKIDKKNYYIGRSKGVEIFLMYEPNKEKLKKLALNVDFAEKTAAKFPSNKKLIFSPATFLDEWSLSEFNIDFAQIPYAIYRYVE